MLLHKTFSLIAFVLSGTINAAPATVTETIQVEYRWTLNGNKHGIVAYTSNGTLLGHSCQNKLVDGNFVHSTIEIDVQDPPSSVGNITIAGTVYDLHSAPKDVSQPTCYRAYSKHDISIECHVPLLDFKPFAISKDDLVDCFGTAPIHTHNPLHHGQADHFTPGLNHSVPSYNQSTALEKRVGTCGIASKDTIIVGNGNPHQNYLHQQVTSNHFCGSQTCSVSISAVTNAWSWSISGTITPFKWISGGFNVGKSYSQSESASCNGNPGETICVWYNVAHTAYTFQNVDTVCCEDGCHSSNTGGPGIIESPNNGGVGGGYYCVAGTCRSIGQKYWDFTGRAGGP